MRKIIAFALAAGLMGAGISLYPSTAGAGSHRAGQSASGFCVSGFSPVVRAHRGPIFLFDANGDETQEADAGLLDGLWSPGSHDSAVWQIRDRCTTGGWLLSMSATVSGDSALASQLVVRIRAREPGRRGLQTVARTRLSRLIGGRVRLRFAAPWRSGGLHTHAVPIAPGKVTKLWFTVAMLASAGNRYQGMAARLSFEVQATPLGP